MIGDIEGRAAFVLLHLELLPPREQLAIQASGPFKRTSHVFRSYTRPPETIYAQEEDKEIHLVFRADEPQPWLKEALGTVNSRPIRCGGSSEGISRELPARCLFVTGATETYEMGGARPPVEVTIRGLFSPGPRPGNHRDLDLDAVLPWR